MSSPDNRESPPDYHAMALSQVAVAQVDQRRNSPAVLLAVISIVLVGVLLIAILGKITSGGLGSTVSGTPLAVGEKVLPDQPRGAIADNPLHTTRDPLPAVDCVLPELGQTEETLKAYYKAGIGCLDRAWEPALTALNLPFRSPGLNIDDKPRTKCGFAPSEEEATAFYCARDKIIYMPRTRLMEDAGEQTTFHLAILAHEYGHHVQALSGILADADEQQSEGEEKQGLEVSRRAELQANCFAGVFLAAAAGRGSVSAALARESAESFEETMGSDTHGSRKNQRMWAVAGFEGKAGASCNTWAAKSDDVR